MKLGQAYYQFTSVEAIENQIRMTLTGQNGLEIDVRLTYLQADTLLNSIGSVLQDRVV